MQIRAWLAHYPRERFLFLTFEEFVTAPGPVLARICAFIGVPPEGEGAGPPAATNVAAEHFDRVRRDRFAARLTARAPILGKIARALPPGLRTALREQAFRLMGKGGAGDVAPPKMLPETRAMLEACYAPQRAEIEALTGLDLSTWWPPVRG